MKSKKILVAGGGLAGSFLSAYLLKAGHSVTLLDNHEPKSASRTAAGLFNIITGRYARLTWEAATLLDSLTGFFKTPPFDSLSPFFVQTPIYRPFQDKAQVNEWTVKAFEPGFRELVNIRHEPLLPGQIENPLGGFHILSCGWLNVSPFLKALNALLLEKFPYKFLPLQWDYEGIDPGKCSAKLDGKTEFFDEIVFTEGIQAVGNPWFGRLVEVIPLKGQVLEVEIPGFEPGFILSRKVFLIPLGGERFACGSTYERNFQHHEPTKEGIDEITNHLKGMLNLPFRVLEARASVRPTTHDRRPIIGTHPGFPHLHILNGLGAKGVLHAPWCANK